MNLSAMNRAGQRSAGLQEREFSISQARSALRYLRPVLADAVDAYQQAQQARQELLKLNMTSVTASRVALCDRRDAAITQLNRTIDECHAVGVCMINIAQGMLGLKVRHAGEPVCLIWRLGEPVDHAWPELDRPNSARQPAYAARQGCA